MCQKTSAAAVASARRLTAATSLSEIGIRRIYRLSADSRDFVQRTGALRWPSRERPVRPPARPLRVLDPRRGVQDPGARAEGGAPRDARRLAHRPRLDGGRDRPLQGGARRRASSRSSAARSTSSTTAASQTKGHAHLTLLAADNTGYANLVKLCSLGYLEGYYYKPRVDWELLERHAPGLIALSGCLSGRVSRALSEHREDDARGGARPAGADLRPRLDVRRAPERRARGAAGGLPRAARRSPSASGCRSSRRATSTTSRPRTRRATTRSSASSRATR